MLTLVALLNLFLSALLVVGLPYLVKISLGLSSLHYSFAEAALSLGSIVGGLLSGLVLRGADIRRAWRFLLGTSLLLLPMALALALGIPSLAAYGVILVSVLLGMACAMLFTVSAQTYLQRATPPHLLGKVASFVELFPLVPCLLGRLVRPAVRCPSGPRLGGCGAGHGGQPAGDLFLRPGPGPPPRP